MTEKEISTILEPSQLLPNDRQRLIEDVLRLTGETFRPDASQKEIVRSVIGAPGRLKTVVTMREDGRLVAFLAGQLLNRDGVPRGFNGDYIVHISSGHSIKPGSSVELMRKLIDALSYHPSYTSGFTQNVRLYETLNRICGGRVMPSYLTNKLTEIYQDVACFLGQVEPVARNKAGGMYSTERPLAKDTAINQWWYERLGVVPENGDLVLYLADLRGLK